MAHRAMVFDVPDVLRPPAPPVPAPGSREVVMVTEHGAGPDLDDNTGAFQAALAAAERLGGATVYVPAGYYRFRGSLTVPPGVGCAVVSTCRTTRSPAGRCLCRWGGRATRTARRF